MSRVSIKRLLKLQELNVMHCWGDDWPHWGTLCKARKYFDKFYYRCTGKRPITKEKFGTIRFEGTFLWIETEEDQRIFREAVMRTIKKFKTVAGEFCSDAGFVLDDEYFEGWCVGICFITTGAYWISDKRPRGV